MGTLQDLGNRALDAAQLLALLLELPDTRLQLVDLLVAPSNAVRRSMAELGRRTFTISEKNIQYPKELTLQDISPSTLRLSVRKVPAASDTSRG